MESLKNVLVSLSSKIEKENNRLLEKTQQMLITDILLTGRKSYTNIFIAANFQITFTGSEAIDKLDYVQIEHK